MVQRSRHHYWKTGIVLRLMGNGKREEEPINNLPLPSKPAVVATTAHKTL